jgi:hypothetical protein
MTSPNQKIILVHNQVLRPERQISLLLFLMFFFLYPGVVMAQAEPIPPCGDSIFPAYAEFDRPPRVQVWSGGALGANWIPPPCTGWTSHGFRVLTAIAATFRDNRNGILDRLGAVSALTGIRYWSVSDKAWEPLVTMATALTGPDAGAARADFTATEIADGKDLFYAQSDNRSSGKVVYRIRVLESGPNRLSFSIENVSFIKLWMVTLFGPGDLQSFHVLNRRSPTTWTYYGLSRTGLGANRLTGGHEHSYENRAVAFYRFLAGIPTDLEPPAAP